MGIKIFKVGEWDKVKAKIDSANLIKGIEAANDLAMKNVTAIGERIVVKMLVSQTLSWPKLQPNTLKRKLNRKPSGSNKILIDTTTYEQSITHFIDNRNGFIGVRRVAAYKNGESIANIAAVHEYGVRSLNIPKRPLFLPAKNLLMAWVKARKPFLDEYKKKF